MFVVCVCIHLKKTFDTVVYRLLIDFMAYVEWPKISYEVISEIEPNRYNLRKVNPLVKKYFAGYHKV